MIHGLQPFGPFTFETGSAPLDENVLVTLDTDGTAIKCGAGLPPVGLTMYPSAIGADCTAYDAIGEAQIQAGGVVAISDALRSDSNGHLIRTAAVAATTTLATTSTKPVDGAQVALGSVTYTFRDALSTGPTIPNEALIGASAATALDAIKAAVNGTNVGTLCSVGTVANPDVAATTNSDTAQVFAARVAGSTPLASTTTGAHLSFPAASFAGFDAGQRYAGDAAVAVARSAASVDGDQIRAFFY